MEEVRWRKIAAESSAVIREVEIVTHDITKKLTCSKREKQLLSTDRLRSQRLPDLSIAQGSII
jgi:hypothetical protein